MPDHVPLRIVDLSRSTAGRFCSKLFALSGEHVTRFVPASEVGARQGGDLAALRHAYLDVDGTVVMDEDESRRRDEIDAAIAAADVVITSFEGGRYDGPYDDERVRALHEGIVHLTLSPFGVAGPYRAYRSSSLVDWAAGGYLYITGEPDREPLAGPPELCRYVAGYTGAMAVEAALQHQHRHGREHVHLDVAVMEAMLGVHNSMFSRASTGEVVGRTGNDVGPATYPHRTYPGRDGNLFLGVVTDEEWDRLVIAIGRPELVADNRLTSGAARKAHGELTDAIILQWLEATPIDEAAARLQGRHVPATRECSAADILRDTQVVDRRFLRPLTVDGVTGQAPGDPVRTDPPLDGIGPVTRAVRSTGGRSPLPLAGVVVLDVTLWWAGPTASRTLGDLGARVIRLERPYYAAPFELPPSQQLVNEKMNRNKVGIALDLKSTDGLALARRLAEQADVIVQNYRPGVLDRLDLGYRSVAEANPGVVYVSLSGFGAHGPKSDWGSYGTLIEAASSIRHRTHYPGGPGMRLGTQLPDGVGGVVGALAALRGLRRRAATGVGVHYDLSQLETYVAMSGEGILAASLGEADDGGAPGDAERVLRCAGDDEWVAVALPDDGAIERVVDRYGGPPGPTAGDAWAVLSQVAATSDKAVLAAALQDLGVAAFPVATGPELQSDPGLAARRFLIDVELAAMKGRLPGSPIHASTPPLVAYRRNAPRLGEHSVEVLRDDLGLSAAEIDDLVSRRVVAVAP